MSPVAARINLTVSPQDCLQLFAGFLLWAIEPGIENAEPGCSHKNVPSGFTPGSLVPAN